MSTCPFYLEIATVGAVYDRARRSWNQRNARAVIDVIDRAYSVGAAPVDNARKRENDEISRLGGLQRGNGDSAGFAPAGSGVRAVFNTMEIMV
jgi:hypothetical protein